MSTNFRCNVDDYDAIFGFSFEDNSLYMTKNIDKLMEAVIQAQSELENVKPNKIARMRTFSYKYVDLGTMIETIKPVALKYGLVVFSFPISSSNRDSGNATMIYHVKSGQYIISGSFCFADRSIHDSGAASTYLRRYQLAGFGCIAPEPDDDAIGDSGFVVDINSAKQDVKSCDGDEQEKNVDQSRKTVVESEDNTTIVVSVVPTSVSEVKSGVHKVMGKDGKEHKKPWSMMKITTADGAYITFDTKIADIIKQNYIGKRVTLSLQKTSQGPRVVGLINKQEE